MDQDRDQERERALRISLSSGRLDGPLSQIQIWVLQQQARCQTKLIELLVLMFRPKVMSDSLLKAAENMPTVSSRLQTLDSRLWTLDSRKTP